MWSWLPDAASVLDFVSAALGVVLAALAVAKKVRREEPPAPGTDDEGK
ncbi:hypothetical protein [Actinoplanes sp. NPDC049599]